MKKSSKGSVTVWGGTIPVRRKRNTVVSTLSFFSLVFWFLSRKTSQLPRIFFPCRTHKILGKDRENTKITKEIPRLKFTKEIQKTKERRTG